MSVRWEVAFSMTAPQGGEDRGGREVPPAAAATGRSLTARTQEGGRAHLSAWWYGDRTDEGGPLLDVEVWMLREGTPLTEPVARLKMPVPPRVGEAVRIRHVGCARVVDVEWLLPGTRVKMYIR